VFPEFWRKFGVAAIQNFKILDFFIPAVGWQCLVSRFLDVKPAGDAVTPSEFAATLELFIVAGFTRSQDPGGVLGQFRNAWTATYLPADIEPALGANRRSAVSLLNRHETKPFVAQTPDPFADTLD
jgi:hypothetical protein